MNTNERITDSEIDEFRELLIEDGYEGGTCMKTFEKLIASHKANERSAFLWNTFTSNQRIRTLGWAKLGEQGYQHMGFEIWTIYGMPEDNYDFTEETSNSIKNLEIYLDAWAATPQPEEGLPNNICSLCYSDKSTAVTCNRSDCEYKDTQ